MTNYVCKKCGSKDIVISKYLIITKDGEKELDEDSCFCNNCDTRTEYKLVEDSIVKECKNCGYTQRKNSRKKLIDTHFEITINNETIIEDMILCNECQDSFISLFKGILDNKDRYD